MKKEIIIHKFGGTSIGSAENISNIIKILDNCSNDNQIIVLSAFFNITNMLESLVVQLKENNFETGYIVLSNIKEIHKNWIKSVNPIEYVRDKMLAQLDALIEQIRTIIQGVSIVKELSLNVEDRILSFGEILSSSLFFIYLEGLKSYEVSFISAFEIIRKDSFGINVNEEVLYNEFEVSNIIVTQGFLCLENGKISNLGRGGSDYSASIIGSKVKAKFINIWTDVNGVLTGSPLIFEEVESLNKISYKQIRELSKYGAKVLHLDTILPAIEENIEVKILNTWDIDFIGTSITSKMMTQKFSITMLDNVLKYTIDKKDEKQYLKRISIILSKLSKEGNELLEVISNIDKTEIYFKNKFSKTNDAIICLINPNISIISNELSNHDFTFDSENRVMKIFVSSDNSKNLLNLIYKKTQKSIKDDSF